jgi:hypothetical protein
MGTGQANAKAYNRLLSRLIERDKVKPSWIVSRELPLEQGPAAYENFDQRKKGRTRMVLNPRGLSDGNLSPPREENKDSCTLSGSPIRQAARGQSHIPRRR